MHFYNLANTLYPTKVLVQPNCLYNSTIIHVFLPIRTQFFRYINSFHPKSGQKGGIVRGSRTHRKRVLTLVR